MRRRTPYLIRRRVQCPILAVGRAARYAGALCSVAALAGDYGRGDDGYGDRHDDKGSSRTSVQLGDRPFFLIDGLDDSRLKDKLQSCKAGPFYKSNFSIAHRGAPLQFPEHTKEAYEAGARQGAGVVECDVTFTRDGELVYRHDECDLHTTTNIVDTQLNASCTVPWAGRAPAPSAAPVTSRSLSSRH